MNQIRQFIKTNAGVFSVLVVLVGVVSFAMSYISTGIPFLFQLFALFCFGIVIFSWAVYLASKPGKFQMIGRIVKWLILVTVSVLFVLFLMVEYQIMKHDNGDSQIPESAKIVIVLGCKVNGETPSRMLRYRLEAALERLEESPDSIAILCGGQGAGENISEAECMKRWLIDHGIAESRLIKEDQSENTRENLQNAAKILGVNSENPTQAVVVSTGFHLFRSKKICSFEGFQTYGIAAQMPDIPFYHLNYYCREFASVLKMYIQEVMA